MNRNFLPAPKGEVVSLWSDRVVTWWIVVLVVVKMWLVQAHDLVATFTPHDDYLFVRLAKNILAGEWLGPYDQITLIKGPVYPLFIAFSHHTGLPLLTAQHLVYCLFAILAVVALRPLIKSRWVLMAIFFLILFNPFTYTYPGTGRAFRFGLSMPLVLGVFSAMCGILLRCNWSLGKQLSWAATFGLTFSLLWYTREEGIWLLPSLALFGLYYLFLQKEGPGLIRLKRIGCMFLIGGVFVCFTSTFSYLNNKYYGAPHIVELKSPEFEAALGGLMNIDTKQMRRYVPVSGQAMEEAFRVSPAFMELRPYFIEKAKGPRWPESFFIWTFRDVVAKSGNSDSYVEALGFYGRIGQEIADACEAKELDCVDRKPTIRPIWYKEYNTMVPEYFWLIFRQAISFSFYNVNDHEYVRWFTNARGEMIEDYRFVTRENLVPGHQEQMDLVPEYYMDMIVEKFRILNDIAGGYKFTTIYLFWAALGAHIFLAYRMIRLKSITFEFVSGCIVLGGILSLVSVLTFVKITLWPVNRPLFSAYPLVLLYLSMMGGFLHNHFRSSR